MFIKLVKDLKVISLIGHKFPKFDSPLKRKMQAFRQLPTVQEFLSVTNLTL